MPATTPRVVAVLVGLVLALAVFLVVRALHAFLFPGEPFGIDWINAFALAVAGAALAMSWAERTGAARAGRPGPRAARGVQGPLLAGALGRLRGRHRLVPPRYATLVLDQDAGGPWLQSPTALDRHRMGARVPRAGERTDADASRADRPRAARRGVLPRRVGLRRARPLGGARGLGLSVPREGSVDGGGLPAPGLVRGLRRERVPGEAGKVA